MQFLRILLGVLGLFFGHFMGRVAAAQHRRHLPQTKTLTWVLRTGVCLAGVMWGRGLDTTAIVFLALTAASAAAGVYVALHPPRAEEIHFFEDK